AKWNETWIELIGDWRWAGFMEIAVQVRVVAGWGRCTWQVISPAMDSRRGSGPEPPNCRSPHARPHHLPLRAPSGWVAVLRVRRPRPHRRARLQRRDHLVLRAKRTRRPRLLPPLARRPEPRRHHHRQLEQSAT